MNSADFDALTDQILARIRDDDRVLGLVLLGSTTARDRRDQWSDHDFFLIVRSGEQETFRNHFWWLADDDDIAHTVRETAHGVQVVLTNGHLLEFAVFDLDEIGLARANSYAVLLDRADVAARVAAVKVDVVARRPVGESLALFMTHVLVGVGRFRRGEVIAARQRLTAIAVPELLNALVQVRGVAAPDSLDLTRRIEKVLPHESAAIASALAHSDLSQSGAELLDIAEWTLNAHPEFPAALLAVVRARLDF